MKRWTIPFLFLACACGSEVAPDAKAPTCPIEDCGPPSVRAAVPTRATAMIEFDHARGAGDDDQLAAGYRDLSDVDDVIDWQLEYVFYGIEQCIVVTPEVAINELTQWRRRAGGSDRVLRLERMAGASYRLDYDVVPTGDEISLTPLLHGEVAAGAFDLTLDIARQHRIDGSLFPFWGGTMHLTAATVGEDVLERRYDLRAARQETTQVSWLRITAWDLAARGGAALLEDPVTALGNGGTVYVRWAGEGGRADALVRIPQPFAISECWDTAGVPTFRAIMLVGGSSPPTVTGRETDCRFAALADLAEIPPDLEQLPETWPTPTAREVEKLDAIGRWLDVLIERGAK